MSIKPIPSMHVLTALALTASLAACAYPGGDQDHGRHHADQSANATAAGPSVMGAGQAAGPGSMPHMNKDAMCAMYRNMQNATTEQDRQAMMERNTQGMSPEMRRRHMEMMRQQCQ